MTFYYNFKVRFTFSLLLLLLPISSIQSQSLEDSEVSNPLILFMDKVYDITPHAEIYEDKTGMLSFEEVVEKKFQPSNNNSYNYGFTSSAIWMRFQVKSQNSFLNDDWIFFVEYPQLDSVNFYFPIDGENGEEDIYIEKEGGDLLPFAKRDIESRVLNYTVPFEIKRNPIIYVRIQSTSVMHIPIYLSPQRFFHIKDNETQIIMGVYFGIMFIMGLYNLFLFVSLKEKTYLYYVLTVFFSILYMVSFHGYGFRHFWSDSVYMQSKMIPLSGLIATVFLNLFTIEFLETKKFIPIAHKILQVLLAISAPVSILCLLLDSNIPIILINIISLTYPFILITCGIMVLFKGNKSARLYLAGWTFAAVVGIFTILRSFGLVQDLRIINYLGLLTGALEVAFFFFRFG